MSAWTFAEAEIGLVTPGLTTLYVTTLSRLNDGDCELYQVIRI